MARRQDDGARMTSCGPGRMAAVVIHNGDDVWTPLCACNCSALLHYYYPGALAISEPVAKLRKGAWAVDIIDAPHGSRQAVF